MEDKIICYRSLTKTNKYYSRIIEFTSHRSDDISISKQLRVITMTKLNHKWMKIFVVMSIALIGFWTVQARAGQLESADLIEQEQIKVSIHNYFDLRYHTLSTLEPEDLNSLFENFNQGNSFSSQEKDKMEIELHHAKLYHLGYDEYKYFLDFRYVSIDFASQTAIVSLFEGHDIVFEVSREISKDKPIVSSMRNLHHRIGLQKYNGVWKIVSDDYEDYLWRLIKATGLTKEFYLRSANESQVLTDAIIGDLEPTYECNLQDDNSTYTYDRQGAVDYANQWALSHNPDYYDFSNDGGDCTNFISQAIYEGGGALMTSDDWPTYGWYYNSKDDKASAWTGVNYFFGFVTTPGYLVWDAGPEGCELDKSQGLYQALEGDIIQYDWTNDNIWDHSVIIMHAVKSPPDWNLYVDSHSPDLFSYVYTSFIYQYPGMDYRFIRIERLDAASLTSLPIVMYTMNGMASQMQNPYPAPAANPIEASESLTPSPYPSP